jgi:hypothetical protein
MWVMLNDSFLSIVNKDSARGELLVRARRKGDIERIFPKAKVIKTPNVSDYLYRASIPTKDIIKALEVEVGRIVYSNFKSSVTETDLHGAYMKVWDAMSEIQHPGPYGRNRLQFGKLEEKQLLAFHERTKTGKFKQKKLKRPSKTATTGEIIDYLRSVWTEKMWGGMDCDRCPGARGTLGHDHPCLTCPSWTRWVAGFRKGKLPS